VKRVVVAWVLALGLALAVGSVFPCAVGAAPNGAIASAIDASAIDPNLAIATAARLTEQARATSDDLERTRLVADALLALDAEPSVGAWSWLREPLQRTPPDLARAQTRLDAAVAVLPLRAVPADPAQARAQLTDVLADRRFQPANWHEIVPGWLLPAVIIVERLFQLIWNIVRWPFDRLLDLLGNLLRSPIMIPLGLAAAIGIVLLYRTAIRAAIVRQAEIALPNEPLPLTAMEALAAAQREATLGRYREASHFLLLSTLLWVQEHEAARFDPSSTNREHLHRAQATAPPAVAQALAPLVAAFDNLWYGTGAVTEADYRSLLDLAARVRETA
jgi:hypothetical protein